MAFLLDLPDAGRRELAARWGVEESTDLLYRTMTDPAALDARLGVLGHSARAALARLARRPSSLDDLVARLPTPAERVAADLDALGALGLVLRQPVGTAPPRPARKPFGDEPLYVLPDIAAALGTDGAGA
jgi:hypothetical protein